MAVKRNGRRGQLVQVKRNRKRGQLVQVKRDGVCVQLVVLGKISSQGIDCSQPPFYFVPHSQAGSTSQGRRKGAPSLKSSVRGN